MGRKGNKKQEETKVQKAAQEAADQARNSKFLQRPGILYEAQQAGLDLTKTAYQIRVRLTKAEEAKAREAKRAILLATQREAKDLATAQAAQSN